MSLKLAFSIIALSLGLGLAAPAEAQQGTFTLKLCNNSGGDILLSVAHRRSTTDNRFMVHGWYAVPTGCNDVPGLPKGWFYYFGLAADGQKFWGGDTNICVSSKGSFERTITQNYACTGDEALVGFEGINVQPNQNTITVTLRP
ncbi:MAG: hypothetical protein QOG83_874 [Alphaproteobacteria bacterium]|jgi:uncharacterized membrane protein|nr:hypothetical protein [Alphaproteobacteria bacterium]MEA2988163.1 hypothetical protein [Alphaproteobacteria bacterium]